MEQHTYPRDFLAAGWNIGIKDSTLDFGVLHSNAPCTAGAVFTRNNIPGFPVIVGREHIKMGKVRTIVVNSKNANVASGPDGLQKAKDTCMYAADALKIDPVEVLPSSTGVIGRPLPIEKIRFACHDIPARLSENGFEDFSRAIMTTDTRPKMISRATASDIRVLGIAKGAGMIEPNMATMLAYVVTDAFIEKDDIQRLVSSVSDRTFNRVSIDSDTSTSDTFVALANGTSCKTIRFPVEAAREFNNLRDPFEPGAIESMQTLDEDSREFLSLFLDICRYLTREIAMDGEGATKLIELIIDEARDREQALKIGRSVINSPLVKTAIYGADPNWGRLVMAVGKVFDEPIDPEKLQIYFGERSLKDAGEEELKNLSEYLKQKEVLVRVILGEGHSMERLWGCDLTEEYVKVNAYYTT